MDHLSSCYFCGTTLDETLRDYRVVPVELRETDDATTATLCQSCHGKLERLLAPVVEAAGENGATLDARGPARQESDTEARAPDPENAEATGPSEADGTVTETVDSDARGDEDDPLVTDVESSLVDIEDQSLTAPDDGTAAEEAQSGDEETVRVRHETDDTGTGERGEREADPGKDSDTDPGEDSDLDQGEDTEAGGETDESGQSTTTQTISALEYNKVMRLLQNREFPVDKQEFVTVAANAYGLAEHECAEVIDLAIDRGLVDERDGQLVRPDSS